MSEIIFFYPQQKDSSRMADPATVNKTCSDLLRQARSDRASSWSSRTLTRALGWTKLLDDAQKNAATGCNNNSCGNGSVSKMLTGSRDESLNCQGMTTTGDKNGSWNVVNEAGEGKESGSRNHSASFELLRALVENPFADLVDECLKRAERCEEVRELDKLAVERRRAEKKFNAAFNDDPRELDQIIRRAVAKSLFTKCQVDAGKIAVLENKANQGDGWAMELFVRFVGMTNKPDHWSVLVCRRLRVFEKVNADVLAESIEANDEFAKLSMEAKLRSRNQN